MKSFPIFPLLAICFALCLSGCPAPAPAPPGATPTPTPISVLGCNAEQLVDTAAASVAASVDNCQNVALLKSDIQALWGTANLCLMVSAQKEARKLVKLGSEKKISGVAGLKTEPLKGVVADLACPFALTTIDNMLSGSDWAVKYGCTGSASIDAAFTAACDLLPF